MFLPGESQGRWSLVGFRLWGRTESDTVVSCKCKLDSAGGFKASVSLLIFYLGVKSATETQVLITYIVFVELSISSLNVFSFPHVFLRHCF